MWILNLGQPVQVPPLNEAMAIELGANLLGEGILFTVGAAVVIIEYRRQAAKQAAKDKEQEDVMNELHSTIRNLSYQLEEQQAQLRGLFRHVYDLDAKVVKIPWLGGKTPVNLEEIADKTKVQSQNVITQALTYLNRDILS